MDSKPQHPQPVRRLILPSGKAIDVVIFDELDQPRTLSEPHEPDALYVCASCHSPFVQPLDWAELPSGDWELDLRCPDCGWEHSGAYPTAQVEDFDLELERGTEVLVRDLRRLTKANMEEELARLRIALEGDHILPMDF